MQRVLRDLVCLILGMLLAFMVGVAFAAVQWKNELIDAGLAFKVGTGFTSAPGASVLRLTVVCGTNSGTAKVVARAGTSTTATTVLDNIGAGISGC